MKRTTAASVSAMREFIFNEEELLRVQETLFTLPILPG